MKTLSKILLAFVLFTLTSCLEKAASSENVKKLILVPPAANKEQQEAIIEEHLRNGARKYHLYSQEWQEEIDKGLAKDSTIAYLWQQKAMPLFKQNKHEAGMEFLDKAVFYAPERYLDYRAVIKCIFARRYSDAITDFQEYKRRFGNGYVMDHSYDFYIGLSLLQLNKFKEAEAIFEEDYHSSWRNLEKTGYTP